MSSRRVGVLAILVASQLLSHIGTLAAADLKPAWHCLPDETVFIARMPQPQAFFTAFRERTKLGAVLLKQDRLDKAVALFKEQAKDGLAEFEKHLGDLNLKLEDWQQLFSGELGLSVSVHPRGEDQAPLVFLLGWLEPGADLGARLLAAIEQRVAEQKETKFPTRRIDLELAGHTVLYLAIPQTTIDDENAFEPLPEDFGKFTPEQRREWQEKQRKKLEDAPRIQHGQVNLYVARLGERLLFGTTIAGTTQFDAFDPTGEKAVHPNFDQASGAEESQGVFARFLAAHAGDAPAATLALLETPGLRQALPDGLPIVEVLGDPRPLWRAKFDNIAEIEPKLKAYGVDGIGPLAYRQTLDGTVTRSGFFLSLPAPRRGVMKLLDQEPGPSEVPNWVTREPIQYQHLHFDLGKAYTTLKQLILQEEGDTAKPAFDLAEGQVQAQLQTDIATLLSSLGSRHSMIQFLPKLDAAGKLNQAKPDPHFGDAQTQRTALVWQLKDEALWQKILQLAAPLAGGNLLEEQGFKGLRAPQAPGAGFFVGHGFLVIGIGEGVLESTLTALRNPPGADSALSGSNVVRKGHELLAPEPGMMYQVLDGARYGKLLGQFRSLLLNVDLPDDAGPRLDVFQSLRGLLPSEAELDGLLSVSVGSVQLNEHGVVMRGALELPAP